MTSNMVWYSFQGFIAAPVRQNILQKKREIYDLLKAYITSDITSMLGSFFLNHTHYMQCPKHSGTTSNNGHLNMKRKIKTYLPNVAIVNITKSFISIFFLVLEPNEFEILYD
jgi:hypothetical protein